MANIRASKKDIRKAAKRTEANRTVKSRLKTLAKKVETLGKSENKEEARTAAVAYVSALDKAVKSGVVHANKASRHKSKIAPLVFAK